MANIKFSAFTQKVAQADVDFLVGYTGADNVRIAPSTLGDGIYLPLAGGTMVGNVIFNDGVKALFGTGSDLEIYHSTDSKIDNANGDLYIRNFADDKDIYFQCDDGSGGVENYFFLDGSLASGGSVYTVFPDNSSIVLGTGNDLQAKHNGTDTTFDNYTGDLKFQNYADDKDIIFSSDDGSGGLATYFYVDGGNEAVRFSKDSWHNDNVKALFGTGTDLQIYHDGSHSRIDETGTGGLIVRTGDFYLRNPSDEDMLYAASGGAVKLYYDNSLKLETTSGGIQVADEVSIGTSIIHTGDTDTKVSFGTDEIVLTTAGADAVKVDSSGDVGIGEPSIDARLHITSLAGGGISNIKLESSGASKWAFGVPAGQTYLAFDETSDDLSTPTMVLTKTTKRVGIGISNPSEKLHVYSTSDARIEAESTTNVAGLKVTNNSGSYAWYVPSGTDNFRLYDFTDTADRITIDGDGNVGIGTDAPATKLTVSGVQHLLELTRGGVGDSKWFASADSAKLYIAEDTTASADIKLTLEDNGDIFIGATSWSGSARVKTFEINPDTISLRSATSDTGLQYHEEFHNANGMVGSIATNASATAFNTSSDYRLKDDLQDFTGLDMVSRIPVYDFKWKSDESRGYGVMAHELQEVLPQAVSGEKDAEEMQGVDYSKIVPLLVKSIQELKAEIEELKNK